MMATGRWLQMCRNINGDAIKEDDTSEIFFRSKICRISGGGEQEMRRITAVFLILSHTVEEGFLPAKTVTVPEHNITKISKTPPFS